MGRAKVYLHNHSSKVRLLVADVRVSPKTPKTLNPINLASSGLLESLEASFLPREPWRVVMA